MKLLIVTQYFPPEIGAPQNRLFELAVRLQNSGVDVTVITAMPNYPQMVIHKEYVGKKYAFEKIGEIKVHRTSIYVSQNKSIISRLRNYFSFVWSSYFTGSKKVDDKYDFVLCESPPLFLGISAYKIAKKKKAKFIFNVSDLWPESAEKMEIVTNKFFLKLATKLEEFLYKKSDLITGQTQGIVANIQTRFPQKNVYWLPNGVDLNYFQPSKDKNTQWRKDNDFKSYDVLFFYGGILGYAQGLETILHAAHKISNHKAKFIFMGSGPEKDKLIQIKNQLSLVNVFFFDAVSKAEMPEILNSIDAAIIPLKKLDLFKGAIPSKIFEALAMEIPLVLGVDGEARELFIEKGNCGLYFEPENVQELQEAIQKILDEPQLMETFGSNGRKFADQHFNRNNIANAFKVELEKLNVTD